ncbi:hypothetical protein AAMO2058_001317500 [Amorphochlora amoebiformis]
MDKTMMGEKAGFNTRGSGIDHGNPISPKSSCIQPYHAATPMEEGWISYYRKVLYCIFALDMLLMWETKLPFHLYNFFLLSFAQLVEIAVPGITVKKDLKPRPTRVAFVVGPFLSRARLDPELRLPKLKLALLARLILTPSLHLVKTRAEAGVYMSEEEKMKESLQMAERSKIEIYTSNEQKLGENDIEEDEIDIDVWWLTYKVRSGHATTALNQSYSDLEKLVLMLEEDFNRQYEMQATYLIRLVLPVLVLGIIATGIYNEVVNKSWRRTGIRIVIFACLIPIVVGYQLLALYRPRGLKTIGAGLAVGIGMGLGLISGFGGEPDSGVHVIYFFVVHMFMRLRYITASLICIFLSIWYLIVTSTFLRPTDRESESENLRLAAFYLLFTSLALGFGSYFVEYWQRSEFYRHYKLRKRHEGTNTLLARFLPQKIVQDLKQAKKMKKNAFVGERVKGVTILFTDIVGFTSYSSGVSAREVVEFLNELYTLFDQITAKHGIYKVETIGDAYFVASGIPVKDPKHIQKMADFSLDILSHLKDVQPMCKNGYVLRMRVGIHTGSVIAGIVGRKMPRYHLFGETVQIASKMESTGVPMRIQVSEPVYQKLKSNPKYRLTPREDQFPLDISALGIQIKTYWLEHAESKQIPDSKTDIPPLSTQQISQRAAIDTPHYTDRKSESACTDGTEHKEVPLMQTVSPIKEKLSDDAKSSVSGITFGDVEVTPSMRSSNIGQQSRAGLVPNLEASNATFSDRSSAMTSHRQTKL